MDRLEMGDGGFPPITVIAVWALNPKPFAAAVFP